MQSAVQKVLGETTLVSQCDRMKRYICLLPRAHYLQADLATLVISVSGGFQGDCRIPRLVGLADTMHIVSEHRLQFR
jgi:hypothetical protein